MKKIDSIYIFALGAYGTGISGGDRIFIEFARRWSRQHKVRIFLWTEGKRMCDRQKLKSRDITFVVFSMKPWKRFGFLVNYFARIMEGIKLGLTLKLPATRYQLPDTIIYSASEFWMDSIPALILKFRYPKLIWLAAWYQTAPSPLSYGWSLPYWLVQQPIKPVISYFADYVLVNNKEERKQFPKLNKKNRVVVVLGAVDLEKIENWKLKIGNLPKVYDAVFQGRFHPQKGVVELIDIWKKVIDKKPDAKLAMIGDGPLMSSVKLKIKSEKLENNIKLFGYVFDGEKKYKIFSQSRVVVHPAFYDSGGMAAAEAMAFGLPCVGFNLDSYKSYYPKGMVKVPVGDKGAFANAILSLLSDKNKYREIASDALKMIEKNWSWEERAKEVIENV